MGSMQGGTTGGTHNGDLRKACDLLAGAVIVEMQSSDDDGGASRSGNGSGALPGESTKQSQQTALTRLIPRVVTGMLVTERQLLLQEPRGEGVGGEIQQQPTRDEIFKRLVEMSP